MEDGSRNRTHFNMASRKAEESAWRRYEATQWLESQVGPLGIPNQPTETELISCLRNGLILCNAINKIHPGAVPKVVVVDNQVPSQSLAWDSQPLPAYQYFENVRNFLFVMEELKLPAFEVSDLERDNLEMGSAAKLVDCILALKSFQELKQMNKQNGYNKHIKSPLPMRMHSRAAAFSFDASRHLDLSATLVKMPPAENNFPKREEIVELLAKQLVDLMFDAKENIDGNIIASLHKEHLVADPIKVFNQIMACCNGEQPPTNFNELPLLLKDSVKEKGNLPPHSISTPTQSDALSAPDSSKHGEACLRKCKCNQVHLLDMQEKELLDLKALKLKIKKEFQEIQSQFQGFFHDIGSQIQEMSTKALGYHKVVEENRKLYNMVQDLKGNIRVYYRIRPSFRAESKNVVDFIGEDGSLFILDPTKTLKDGRKLFQFNQVFGPIAGQDDVYKDTQPLIRSVMDGYNVCIFAYGQTGSGKTYTMSGPSGGGTSKDMGINYLALNDLFQMSNERKDIISYDIYVQMVEIYNEQVRDLLAEDKTDNKLEIRSCNDDGLSLPDAILHSVKSPTDVMTLIKLGEVNRAVSSTAMNNRSSRSHSVLTVHVNGKDTSGSSIRSCLHLVDLAGSERVDKSEVTGERLKEAQFINKSLSCLGDVITALAQKNSHIPYRNSKLTLLLQDSLGGHAKTLMFAHVSPESDSFGETMSTLKFAQRVSTVELGAARMNKESSEVMHLKEQVENLKIALAAKEAQRVTFQRIKEPHTPSEKSTLVSEKTPLRPRRLSIENCSAVKTDKPVNREDRGGVKSPLLLPRLRRLSLEGSKTIKRDSLLPKVSDNAVSKALQYERVSQQKYHPMQDPESVSKLNGHFSSGNSRSELHARTPQSPTSISYQTRLIKVNGGMQVHPLKLPKTPEPPVAPNETPTPLVKYRKEELENLRGDGKGERKEYDRIYDYDVYNDLGNPDKSNDLARPVLGGSSAYPYPRRGRTGRKPTTKDPKSESPSSSTYIPRDENFGHLKSSDFLTYGIKSIAQTVLPTFQSAFGLNAEFDRFDDVRGLFEGGIHLPTDALSKISPLPVLKEIFRTDGEQVLKFPPPHVIKVSKSAWMTDEEFGREMLAGVNPCLIECLQVFPPKSKLDPTVYGDQTSTITKEHLEINLGGLSVEQALSGNRLFILDHHDAFIAYLRKINDLPTAKSYATRTILFLKDDGTLKPLAIELSLPHPRGDEFGAVSRVVLPADQGAESTIWLIAKAYVVVNDSCYHQLMSHWLNTHAVIEPFVIATNRHLSVLHPIYKLLLPHYRDTMNINGLARQSLINAGGIIEQSFLPGPFAVEMSSAVYKGWVFTDQALPADLIKRGMAVEDPSSPYGLRLVIDDYPYAVDGLEIWSAIQTWVKDYVSLYYATDDAVKKDSELQAWWKEAVEKGHGDLKDKPWWPKLNTLQDLIHICCIIIWTASALHAAVNFGQYPYGGFILNRPTLTRRLLPEPGTKEYGELTSNHQKAYLRTITGKTEALVDLTVIEILSRHASDEVYLGQRDNPNWTDDTKAIQAFKKFGNKLKEIEDKISGRNKNSSLRNRNGPAQMPYTVLLPTSGEGLTFRGIPNSISI